MSGSFAIPFDRVKGWKWEHYWLVYSLFAYVVVPLLICLIVSPNFILSIRETSSEVIGLIAFLGAIYGFANLTFGLSLRYLGIALGFALSLGLMMVLGTIIPPLLDGRLALLFEGSGGVVLLIGILVAVIGIGISAYAGYQKTRHLESQGLSERNPDFNLKKGVLAALFVGVTGASAALGIEQGKPLSQMAMQQGTDPFFQDSALFLVLYSGSFLVTLVWCLVMAMRGGSVTVFVRPANRGLLRNYLFCALAGFLWFINYLFYGMGKSLMGEFSFVGWGILMSLTIVCATLWGIYRGEWRGATGRITATMWTGLGLLVFASFLIALSSNLG